MTILNKFNSIEYWKLYLEELEAAEDYIDKRLIKRVKSIVDAGIDTEIELNFPIPVKKEITKHNTSKKRIVYTYKEPYNTYLKMMNWLLQTDKEYASKFCVNSYAYQKNKSVGVGVKRLHKEILINRRKKYIKTDFSDYFNSINLEILSKKMFDFFRPEDAPLACILLNLLNRPDVYVNGKLVEIMNKGVMAGTPISGYLANLYMNDVDWEMYRKHIYYIRYADDVFILTNNIERDLERFISAIEPLKLNLNPTKTDKGVTAEGFTVLGFYFRHGVIDVDEAKVQKMFGRIKRRSRWFRVWEKRKNVKNEVMVRTFIKGMNAKLYSGDAEDKLNWSRWYFASINTVSSLERIDAYLVQYIRYLVSGKQLGYKKHSEVSYEYVKKLGYVSLVNRYWKYKKKGAKDNGIHN
jgi:hypothetical protein